MRIRELPSETASKVGTNSVRGDWPSRNGALSQLEAERDGPNEVFANRCNIPGSISALKAQLGGHRLITMALTQLVAPPRSTQLETAVNRPPLAHSQERLCPERGLRADVRQR